MNFDLYDDDDIFLKNGCKLNLNFINIDTALGALENIILNYKAEIIKQYNNSIIFKTWKKYDPIYIKLYLKSFKNRIFIFFENILSTNNCLYLYNCYNFLKFSNIIEEYSWIYNEAINENFKSYMEIYYEDLTIEQINNVINKILDKNYDKNMDLIHIVFPYCIEYSRRNKRTIKKKFLNKIQEMIKSSDIYIKCCGESISEIIS